MYKMCARTLGPRIKIKCVRPSNISGPAKGVHDILTYDYLFQDKFKIEHCFPEKYAGFLFSLPIYLIIAT